MDTKILLTAIIALIIGGTGGYLIGNSPKNQHMMPDGSQMHGGVHSGMQGEMDAMMAALDGKTGDEFDKAFLSEMIMHHQGAVEMAEAALQNAKHTELKTMADAIISAQTTEIQQMQEWQRNWYGAQ